MKKILTVLACAAAAVAGVLASADDAMAQKKKAAKAAPKAAAAKAYAGPASHRACATGPAAKRDNCIRNLPVSVFSTVKSAPVKAAGAAAPAAAAAKGAKESAPAKAAPAPKGYVGPANHLACAKMSADKRDACIRNLPVVRR